MPNFKLEYVAKPKVSANNDMVEAIVRFVFEGEWSSNLLVGKPTTGFSNKSDGWVIQHIVMTAESFDGDGDSEGKKTEDEYWEVWRVDGGTVYIPEDGKLEKFASRGDTFTIQTKQIRKKHHQLTAGCAVFVHDADDDYNFPADRANWQTNVGAAKSLPSRKAFIQWDSILAKRKQAERTVLNHKLGATFEKMLYVKGSLVAEPAAD